MTLLIAVFLTGWIAAAVLGTQAYFRGEQTKPIHEPLLAPRLITILGFQHFRLPMPTPAACCPMPN
jgi:hypothetical protein